MIDLTFVVPCLNASQTLSATLESILNQKTSYSFEVIVVDNGSADNTLEIAKKFGSQVLVEKSKGANHARNLGIKNAKGKYIAFVDSDVVIDTNWAEELLGYVISKNLVGAQGRIILSGEKSKFLNRYRSSFTKNNDSSWIGFVTNDNSVGHINTAACIYKVSTLKSVGSFSSSISIHEDVDLFYKVRSLPSGSMGATKSANAYCYYTGSLASYLKRSLVYGYESAKIRKKWDIKDNQASPLLAENRGSYIFLDLALYTLDRVGLLVGEFVLSLYQSKIFKKEKVIIKKISLIKSIEPFRFYFENNTLNNNIYK